MPIALLSGARTKKILAALEGNWQAEMEGFHTYTALADRDSDPVRAQVMRRLAQAEIEHLEENVASAALKLSPEEWREVEAAAAPTS